MKKILRYLAILAVVLVIGYIALGLFNRELNDFGDDFLNAVYRGNVTKVEAMLNAGENPNKHDSYGQSPIILAAYEGYSNIIKILIAKGGKVDSQDNSGMTPLHCAAYNNRIDAARVLLNNGAHIDSTDNYGFTPLSESVIHGFSNMTRLLLDSGASVTNRDKYGWQPLHEILRSNRIDANSRLQIVILLLEHGANPNEENPGGWEKDSAHDSSIGFRTDKENPNRGNTPLAIAESNSFVEIADVLRKHGARK